MCQSVITVTKERIIRGADSTAPETNADEDPQTLREFRQTSDA